MNRLIWLLLGAGLVLSQTGCHLIMWLGYPSYEINHTSGTLPAQPIALAGANTPYDDYNAAAPPELTDEATLFFSSNRGTRGGAFDIVAADLRVSLNQDDGGIGAWASMRTTKWSPPPPLVALVRSERDELGPHRLVLPGVSSALERQEGEASEAAPEEGLEELGEVGAPAAGKSSPPQVEVFLFASDRGGNLDIFYVEGGRVRPATALNSPQDDAYPTFDLVGGHVYFCSNRGGSDFDIYRARFKQLSDLATALPVERVAALSSPTDDKCPHIQGDRLLLVSKRAGGRGGFDVWRSRRTASSGWATLTNLAEVNTPSDEYRPIIVPLSAGKFTNDLMMFSSDRPGGQGGFDLYWRGIER